MPANSSPAGRSARLTAAAFAIGLSMTTPAIAAADTGEAADATPAAQSAGQTGQPNRAEAGTARSSRGTGSRAPRSGSATPAAAAATTAASRRDHSDATVPRSASRRSATTTAGEPKRTARTPAADTETQVPQAYTADEPVTAAPISTVETTVPAPTAAATALTITSTPTARAAVATDWLSGLLAPVRSFIDGIALLIRRTFFNQAPTVTPVQTTGQLEGPITGTVGAVDPEGDPLTYAVTQQPRYGTVAVGTDGSYVYTPGSDFTGLDSFNVAVTDTGFHLNLLDPSRPASTEAFLQVAQNATLPMLTFNFVYGRGSQYWSLEARRALQDSAMVLATYFVVTSPTTLVYTVTGDNSTILGLASAGSDLTSKYAGFFPTVVQMKIQSGVDANGPAPDGEINWNFGYQWGLGASVGAGEFDFTSTAMHELLHTFGFMSYVEAPGTNTDRTWPTFARYLVTSDGTPVLTGTYRWRSVYDANLTGAAGGLYFGGPNAVAVYGGPVPLYTPDPWTQGSSMSHLDDNTFTGSAELLMNSATDPGPGVRVISPVELAILKDLGYTVTNPSPLSAIVLIGFGFLRRRAQRPVS